MDLSALSLPTDDPVLLLAVDPGLEAGHRLPVNGADPAWRAAFGADCVPARRLTLAETLQCLKRHPAMWQTETELGHRLRQLQWALSVRAANTKQCAKAAQYAELLEACNKH